jgi:hypothetical protein
MQNIAYSDRSATRLLGILSFLIPYLIIKAIISIILKLIILSSGNSFVTKAYKIISNDLFFNSFIKIAIECLFTFIIVSYLNLKTLNYSTFGEVLGVVLSYYCIVFSIAILPLTVAYTLIFKRYKYFNKISFIKRWGALFNYI